jgi:hypothetical protein
MDICTLIFILTFSTNTPCPTTTCSTTLDGKRQICSTYCPAPPVQYSCTKPTGESYIWEPKPGEDVILKNAN